MAFDGKMFAQALGQGLMKRGQGQSSTPNFQDAFAQFLKKKKMSESSGIDYKPGMEKAKELEPMLTPGLELAKKNSSLLPPGLGMVKDIASEVSPVLKLGEENLLGKEEKDDEEKKRKNFFKYLG